MDQYNVIDLSTDLDSLETDMTNWSNLPFNFRMRSDEECIRRYNMTNTELFNVLKAGILSGMTPDEDPKYLNNLVIEGAIPDIEEVRFPETEYLWRKQMSEELEKSPNIIILCPFSTEVPTYNLEELDNKYMKYTLLTEKNKRFSNSYSMDLWGYNVPNMYKLLRNKIEQFDTAQEEPEDNLKTVSESVNRIDSVMNPYINSVNKKIMSDDKLGLCLSKLDSCCEVSEDYTLYAKSINEYMNPEIDQTIDCGDFSDTIPTITPFFTPDEMDIMCPINRVSNIEYSDYYKELMNTWNKGVGVSDDLISLGWNPSVEPNEKNFEFARQRQLNWLKNNAAKIIDITNLKSVEDIQESTANARKLYKDNNLYPVYIVLSYSYTFFNKVVRFFNHAEYAHAGLSLDSNLKTIYSFGYGKDYNGFKTESIDTYINASEKSLLDVLVIFVDGNTKRKLEYNLKEFVEKKDKTKYGFGNLLNILFNRKREYDPKNLSLVCSQFVDVIFKLANIDITNKSSNLVAPQDFEKVSGNPKIYKVYEGLTKEYNEKAVENAINMLLKTKRVADIKYHEYTSFSLESFTIELFFAVTDNDKANKVLETAQDLLTPNCVVMEKKLPIRISDSGDVTIELRKALEDQYQESHKLLIGYTKDNLEGIKHELARLYYLNSVIEKKIKKMKKDDESYKPLIDLRARILNDFKKYFKVVAEQEPNFDFTKYFQDSDYYNGTITIDGGTLKFTGKLIKLFLKTLGI